MACVLCCAVSYLSGSESDDLESVSSEDEEMCEAVFVSTPEPAWLTRDWRRRLWQARCAQQKQETSFTAIMALLPGNLPLLPALFSPIHLLTDLTNMHHAQRRREVAHPRGR